MPDFEGLYGQHGSRFSEGMAAGKRGSFAQYLENDGGNFAAFAGNMASGWKPPSSSNATEQQAAADSADARNQQQFGENLNRVNNQFGQQAQLGFNAVSQIQSVQQAKEMAQLQAQSAQQGAMFDAIQSGISFLGGVGKQQGWFGGGKTSTDLSRTTATNVPWSAMPTGMSF